MEGVRRMRGCVQVGKIVGVRRGGAWRRLEDVVACLRCGRVVGFAGFVLYGCLQRQFHRLVEMLILKHLDPPTNAGDSEIVHAKFVLGADGASPNRDTSCQGSQTQEDADLDLSNLV